MLVHAAGGQAHGQTHALLNDGALQEDVLAQLAFLAGDDGVGDLAHQVVGLLTLDVGVSHACHLGEHLTAIWMTVVLIPLKLIPILSLLC